MSKKIKITQKQLEEAMDIMVNKMGTENTEQALRRTKKETEQQLGGNRDINYIVPSTEVKESRRFSKKELMESRRKYLNNNSEHFTKENFLKK